MRVCLADVSGERDSRPRQQLKRSGLAGQPVRPGARRGELGGGWRGRRRAEGAGPCGPPSMLGVPRGSAPELSLSLQTSRCRTRRNVLSPLPSASDTAWMGSSAAVQSHRRWSLSGGPRQPKNSGSQGPWAEPLDKEAWVRGSNAAGTGALRWSWDEFVDRGDGGPPRAASCWGPGSAARPSLRRRFLGEPPEEGSRKEWAREPLVRARRGAKDHSLGTVTWACH